MACIWAALSKVMSCCDHGSSYLALFFLFEGSRCVVISMCDCILHFGESLIKYLLVLPYGYIKYTGEGYKQYVK